MNIRALVAWIETPEDGHVPVLCYDAENNSYAISSDTPRIEDLKK